MAKITAMARKQLLTEANNSYYKRTVAITKEFNDKPENKIVGIPYVRYPTVDQALLKLAGFDSPAEIIHEGEELQKHLSKYRSHSYIYPQDICKPINNKEIEEAKAKNAQITERRKIEVDNRTGRFNTAYSRCVEIIKNANDLDLINYTIKNFEETEF